MCPYSAALVSLRISTPGSSSDRNLNRLTWMTLRTAALKRALGPVSRKLDLPCGIGWGTSSASCQTEGLRGEVLTVPLRVGGGDDGLGTALASVVVWMFHGARFLGETGELGPTACSSSECSNLSDAMEPCPISSECSLRGMMGR